MDLYMSFSSVHVAGKEDSALNEEDRILFDDYYHMYSRVFDVYDFDKEEDNRICGVPCVQSEYNRIEFLSQAFEPMMRLCMVEPGNINYLYDCHSTSAIDGPAAAYRLAKRFGLIHAIPLELSGNLGTEFVQAIEILRRQKTFENAVFSVSQIVSKPDKRHMENGYALGDSAISLIVTEHMASFAKIKIIYSSIQQLSTEPYDYINELIKDINENIKKFQWIICQNASAEWSEKIKSITDPINFLNRKNYQNVNFGCADVFVTLDECIKEGNLHGTGLLCFIGRHRSIGFLLVEIL